VTNASLFPDIDYEGWRDTLDTVHRFAQLVGKVRLAASPPRNHWWNVPFHLTGRGITTRPMGLDPTFTVDFDFLDHRLDVNTVDGARMSIALPGLSVAEFAASLDHALTSVGVAVQVAHPHPFGLPDAARPFVEDTEHCTYDTAAVTRYWRVLSRVNVLLEEFAGRWSGKVSPVHHFWHTFDIAHTRFADRRIEHPREVDPVTREAYSREVISFGFWFGDPAFPEPAFYAYAAPEPAGIADEPLAPDAAEWLPRGGSHLAVLRYADVRGRPDAHEAILAFWQSAHRAAAGLAGWGPTLDCHPPGVTDPYAAGP
jgi:Family of unknown function (DUF5996)